VDEELMKRQGYLFEDICSYSNLLAAFNKALKGSGKTYESCQFHFHLESELFQLREELMSGTYSPSRYRYFKICDPKERIISVAAFRDRVVHHAVVKALESIFERSFIYDSYATRTGKGTHRAVLRAQSCLRSNQFYLKIDIEKYFDSINHTILLKLVERKIKDPQVNTLIRDIVRNSDLSRGLEIRKGLPIGNLTSQFFANVYLDPFDHFIKDELGVKHYIRYMDDMVFFSMDRESLNTIGKEAERFLSSRLRLSLKKNVTMINTRFHGLPFLGFRIFPHFLRVRSGNLKRTVRKMKSKTDEYYRGTIDETRFVMSLQSIVGHLAFADSMQLRRSVFYNGPSVE
jgi:retron-type reverse transcriptase